MKATKETKESLRDWASRVDKSQDPDIGFVETLYQTCSNALVYLWRSQFRLKPYTSHKSTLKKDVANIRLWEENFPPSHLDTILGESDHLKTNVVENLRGIGSILMPFLAVHHCTAPSAQIEKQPSRGLAKELEIHLEKAAIMLSAEENSDSPSDDEASDDSSSTNEREQNRYGQLHCYVNCLMDLAPLIEKYISRLQHKVGSRSTPLENVFRVSQSVQPYAIHIRDLFMNASTPLVERLAEANWERFIRIRGQEEEEPSTEDNSGNHDALTLIKPYSMFQDSDIETSIPAKWHYAATAASHAPFPSERAQGHPRVPALPREGGLPFKCDYCRKTVSMQNRIEWKIHIFADLQSYVCTHTECKDALKKYPSRKLWADHEFSEHLTLVQWRCIWCNITTVTQKLFVDHLIKSHEASLAEYVLTVIISEAKETFLKPEFENYKCALCSQSGWQSRKDYATHVAQHLEQISLVCLPREEGGSSNIDLNVDTPCKETKSTVLSPSDIDSYKAESDSGNGEAQATRLPNAPFKITDSTIDTSKQQKIKTELDVERLEDLPPHFRTKLSKESRRKSYKGQSARSAVPQPTAHTPGPRLHVADMDVPPKAEEYEDCFTHKHPLPKSGRAKIINGRSKTGCFNCRRRKKKCDETKPVCLNCVKRAVACEGYNVEKIGKNREKIFKAVPHNLPFLIDSIETDIDRRFLDHFVYNFSGVLVLIDEPLKPFKDILLPMATQHRGLMHSLMCLSGSNLSGLDPEPKLKERKYFHFHCAIKDLKDNITASSSKSVDQEQQLLVEDPIIASTIMLSLNTICEGETKGEYQSLMDAARYLLVSQKPRNENFRQFIVDFFHYHDISNTHLPLRRRPELTQGEIRLPGFILGGQAGILLGVIDGLFRYISEITILRDRIGQRIKEGYEAVVDYQTLSQAVHIDTAIRNWTTSHEEDSLNWLLAQLHRQSTWVYLYRTILPSRPSDKIAQVVDDGLLYLDRLPQDADAYNIVLLPLFLLGCSAFAPRQREHIQRAFDNLKANLNHHSIESVFKVVMRVWDTMDTKLEDSWDWEKIIRDMNMDFSIT